MSSVSVSNMARRNTSGVEDKGNTEMLLQDAIWTDLELLAPEQRVMELEEVSRDAWHSPIAKQDTDLHELKEINVSPSCYC